MEGAKQFGSFSIKGMLFMLERLSSIYTFWVGIMLYKFLYWCLVDVIGISCSNMAALLLLFLYRIGFIYSLAVPCYLEHATSTLYM